MDKELYKQKIHQLVEKIKEDPELFYFLQNEIGNNQDIRIGHIEKYLGLDYNLDSISPNKLVANIDYSFILNSSLRNQLTSDFREMMRYRYGTRSHKADFYEFCKFAHFQLEALTNLYLEAASMDDEDNVDIDLVKQNILSNWVEGWTLPNLDGKKNIQEIDCSTKVTAVLNMLELNKQCLFREKKSIFISEIFKNIRLTRNAQSHRSSVLEKNEKIEIWISLSPFDEVLQVLAIYINSLRYNLD